jgi:20S proteasome subunit alpha 5
MSRPFGVALLLGGYDDTGFSLIYADPSGTYAKYSAKAIGSGAEVAQSSLEDKWTATLEIKEATVLGLSIMKNIMEDKLTHDTVHVCIIDSEGFKLLYPPEIEGFLQLLPN